MRKEGHKFTTSSEVEVVRQIKGSRFSTNLNPNPKPNSNFYFLEKACYISSVTGKEETADDQQREYQLPDGEKIMIGNSKFKAPEILFKPERKWSPLARVW